MAGLAAAMGALLVVMTSEGRGQIVTENAGVQSPELPSLVEQLRLFEAENATEVRLTSQLTYSFTPSFEARLSLPAIRRDVDLDLPSGNVDGDALGIGDVSLRLKHSLWQADDVMASTRWAAIVESSFPVGEHHEEVDGLELPRRLQPGAGGFGFGIGSAFTLIRDRHRFSAEAIYRHWTRHDGFRLGDSASLNLAYWFRLFPAEFRDAEAETEVRPVLELLTTWWDDSHGRTRGFDGGGTEVWLAPGIQIYASPRVLFEASFQVPLYDDVDDAFGDRRWAASVGVKILF